MDRKRTERVEYIEVQRLQRCKEEEIQKSAREGERELSSLQFCISSDLSCSFYYTWIWMLYYCQNIAYLW